MGFDIHTIDILNGSTLSAQDRVKMLVLPGQTISAGASVGSASTLTIGNLDLPATYVVLPGASSQNCALEVTGKTQAGFTLTASPFTNAGTIVAGTVDLVVIG